MISHKKIGANSVECEGIVYAEHRCPDAILILPKAILNQFAKKLLFRYPNHSMFF